MLKEAFGGRIAVVESAEDWKDAIRLAVEPLIRDGVAEPRYLDGIYENIAQNGDYIIVAPDLAIPHTRAENGALNNGFSLVKLKNKVTFSSGEDVSLLIAFAATDPDQHLDMQEKLTDLVMDDAFMAQVDKAATTEELKELFK